MYLTNICCSYKAVLVQFACNKINYCTELASYSQLSFRIKFLQISRAFYLNSLSVLLTAGASFSFVTVLLNVRLNCYNKQ